MVATLKSSTKSLVERHDVAMLDLDGVVYVGAEAVPGAPGHLSRAREQGLRLAFVTNNASRPPQSVSRHLSELGVPAEPEDVVTSAQAAAGVLLDRFGPGSRILVLGAEGLLEAVIERGLEAVTDVSDEDSEVAAVVTGYAPDMLWRDLMRVAARIRDGLPWVASNEDLTIPTDYGLAPGHGVLVRMLRDFTGVVPDVAGKPQPPLLRETIARTRAQSPLMVGDRLDTDIAGGRAVEVATLLVMTGVTDLEALVRATPDERPDHLAADLGGLGQPQPEIEVRDGAARAGVWSAEILDGALRVRRVDEPADGPAPAGASDWWRAVAVASWRFLDETGQPVRVTGLVPPER